MEEKSKRTYKAPDITIVLFGSSDVIVTSGPIGSDGTPDFDDTAWA